MSINSHCVYLNTPLGGGGVRHTVFCITWTNTKITLIFKHFNNQTIQQSKYSTLKPPPKTRQHPLNSTFPNNIYDPFHSTIPQTLFTAVYPILPQPYQVTIKSP